VTSTFEVQAPSVAVIGWIPYRRLDTIPNVAWRDHPKQTAFRNLFRSGNAPDPPARLGDADLDALVDSRNFRAALSVKGLRLARDENELTFRCPYHEHIGYTMFRLGGSSFPFKGIGHLRPEMTRDKDCARLHLSFDFKLGRVSNLGGWVMTGHWAPSAWIDISYELRADGSWTLEVTGSGIPSAAIYLDAAQIHRHDMLDLRGNAIDRFITAGDCADAPREMRFQWSS
jgi:hypothetical protein